MAERLTSVEDLIHACNDAAGKMGADNSHRNLIFNCAYAMQQLVQQIAKLEAELAVKETKH